MVKKEIKIKGMHCASCVLKIERALKKVKGVKEANVNLATEKAVVEYDGIKEDTLFKAIRDVGYEPLIGDTVDREKEARQKEIRVLRNKFIIGAILSIFIFLGSFPEWFPWYPKQLQNYYVLFLLTIPVQFWVGSQFYKGFWNALKHKTSDMNSLITIGTSAAFFYSFMVTFFPFLFKEAIETAVYYDTAAIIITLIILGRWLEAKAKGKTSEAIKKLIGLQAKTALV